ncbi:hypothetical protein GCM10010428_36590 [Actinosynnema pretiosum subsp. pretiosum]
MRGSKGLPLGGEGREQPLARRLGGGFPSARLVPAPLRWSVPDRRLVRAIRRGGLAVVSRRALLPRGAGVRGCRGQGVPRPGSGGAREWRGQGVAGSGTTRLRG